jgi:SPOR domain
MKRWILLSLLFVPLLASAASFWDGNAALQRGDASFESGLYATSNSFPAGTQISIQNQDTGRTVTATVTGRIEGQSDILVLLSPKTADALGLTQGTLGRVRVTVPSRATASTGAPGEQTASSDPDVNPAAAYGQPDATVASAPAAPSEETLPSPVPATAAPADAALASVPPTAAPEAPAEEQPSATTPSATTTQATTTPAATTNPAATGSSSTAAATSPSGSTTDADNAAIIAAAGSRVPQKQVFQPPREDEKFAYKKPATTPVQATATVTEPPAITAVEGEQGVSPAAEPATDLALADVAAPEESHPEEIVGAGAAAPPPTGDQPQVALASPDVAPEAGPGQEPVQTEVSGPAAVPPAGQAPPKVALLPPEAPVPASAATAATTTTVAATTPAATVTTPPVKPAVAQKTGAPGSFFLQLAAYGTEKNARDLAAKLTPTYPAMVLAPSNPKTSVFKVVIGPLNRAESGTLLTWFRYRGFPDAFVKQE